MKTHKIVIGLLVGGLLGLLPAGAATTASSNFGQPTNPTFEQANRAFSEENYKEAIQGYETILKENGVSAPVLFNLANAQYRNGQIGEAILNLERAKVLRPRDPDIVANLNVIRNAASLSAPVREPWYKAASFLSWNEWAWLACGALGLMCFFVLLRAMQPAWNFAFFNFILLLIWLAALAGMGGLWTTRHDAVVVAKDTTTRISPFATAAAAFPVKEGEIVTAQAFHEQYVLIRNHLGKIAWLPRDQAEMILTASLRLP